MAFSLAKRVAHFCERGVIAPPSGGDGTRKQTNSICPPAPPRPPTCQVKLADLSGNMAMTQRTTLLCPELFSFSLLRAMVSLCEMCVLLRAPFVCFHKWKQMEITHLEGTPILIACCPLLRSAHPQIQRDLNCTKWCLLCACFLPIPSAWSPGSSSVLSAGWPRSCGTGLQTAWSDCPTCGFPPKGKPKEFVDQP